MLAPIRAGKNVVQAPISVEATESPLTKYFGEYGLVLNRSYNRPGQRNRPQPLVQARPVIPSLREGINYSRPLLDQALTVDETEQLLNLISTNRVTETYPLIEVHSNIGTSSLVYADQLGKRITNLLLIENDVQAMEMLQRNFKLYGRFDDPHISFAESFDRVDQPYYGGVGVFVSTSGFRTALVPPTKPEDYSNFSSTQLTNNIFIGPQGRTAANMQVILTKIPNLQLTLFIVPLGYPIPMANGFSFSSTQVSNFQVLIAQSKVGQNLALSQFAAKENEQNRWLQTTLKFVANLLTDINAIISKEGIEPFDLDIFLAPEWHWVWRNAFTSEDYNPDSSDNYQRLEALGDKTLKGSFATLLSNQYDDLTEEEFTNLENKYMSKRYQPLLSDNMGLAEHALYREGEVLWDLKEDLFESVAGAICYIADRAYGPPAGMARVYHYLYYNFYDNIPTREQAQPVTTQVKQALEALWFSWEMPNPVVNRGKYSRQLFIPESMDYLLRQTGRVIPNRQLAAITAVGEKESKELLFTQALETLKTYNITQDVTKAMANAFRIDTSRESVSVQGKMKLRKANILYILLETAADGQQVYYLWEVLTDNPSAKTSNKRNQTVAVYAHYQGKEVPIEQIRAYLLKQYLTFNG